MFWKPLIYVWNLCLLQLTESKHRLCSESADHAWISLWNEFLTSNLREKEKGLFGERIPYLPNLWFWIIRSPSLFSEQRLIIILGRRWWRRSISMGSCDGGSSKIRRICNNVRYYWAFYKEIYMIGLKRTTRIEKKEEEEENETERRKSLD